MRRAASQNRRLCDSSSFDGNEKDAPEGGERDADEPGGVDKRRPLPHGCLQVIFKGLIAVLLLATLFGSYALPLSALASGKLSRRSGPLLVLAEAGNFLVGLPIWPLNVCYGSIYGLTVGCPIAIGAYGLGCAAPFLLAPMLQSKVAVTMALGGWLSGPAGRGGVSRWVARQLIGGWLSGAAILEGLKGAIVEHPFLLVASLRLNLVPPAGLTSYALGLCPIPLTTYLTASAVGSVPNVAAYVYLGTMVTSVADLIAGRRRFDAVASLMLGLGFVASLVLMTLFSRAASAHIRRCRADQHSPGAESDAERACSRASAAVTAVGESGSSLAGRAADLEPDQVQPPAMAHSPVGRKSHATPGFVRGARRVRHEPSDADA